MIVLTGLTLSGKKYQKMQQLESFFDQELNIRPFIEDFYSIGEASTRSTVIIFQSLRDKALVMRFKSGLKGLVNEKKKPFFINDYMPAKMKEQRRKHKEIYMDNQSNEDTNKPKLELVNGALYIGDNPFEEMIKAPNPQDMLDYTTAELNKLMDMKINKGAPVYQEDNIFYGFSVAVDSLQDVQDAYMKMRLTYPKARHIICAYYIRGDDHLHNKGYCDDGEHAAGTRLLQILINNNFICRAVFVVRYYSGKKIGKDRFSCIEKALFSCLETYPWNNVLGIQQEAQSEEDYNLDNTSETQEEIVDQTEEASGMDTQDPEGALAASHREAPASMKRKQTSPADTPQAKANLKHTQRTFNPDGSFTIPTKKQK